ncbi:HigA family addiction module antitoxin [Paraburkholderia silvatlantica]|uniref:Addiction module HigA family antidote n=1 Tax=Paraburkholderia silvatlantica TaxID=321895 RepID=A0ABR6FZ82_9BURK|nr:HigA family addiction module antitoxin [Paraburkholderia silvatlantica]MBB2932731.1 addiction module HigA family antidote [Paraburkholderia silvatlantica]PVY21480.1 addiction module HigA family antidote [Paraburkholderia silvatlantica]PXW26077.1 addiction module HigA family antidote [Paraburkholderia silvatlantica]
MPRDVSYPHPGEILSEDFMLPMDTTAYRLAKEIGVDQTRIGEIISGRRAITVDTGLRLSRFFGISDEFWTGLQLDFDTAHMKDELARQLDAIHPFEPA